MTRLVPLLLLTACEPPECVSFEEVEVTDRTGEATPEMLDEARGAIEAFAADSGRTESCAVEVRIVDSLGGSRLGAYRPLRGLILVKADQPDLGLTVRHELCHDLDAREDLSWPRADLFPAEDAPPSYSGEVERTGEVFARVCETWAPRAFVADLAETCDLPLVTERDEWVADVVLPHMEDGMPWVDADLAPRTWRPDPSPAIADIARTPGGWVALVGNEAPWMLRLSPDLSQIAPAPVEPLWTGRARLVDTDDEPLIVEDGMGWTLDLATAELEELPVPSGMRDGQVYGGTLVWNDGDTRAWDLASGVEIEVDADRAGSPRGRLDPDHALLSSARTLHLGTLEVEETEPAPGVWRWGPRRALGDGRVAITWTAGDDESWYGVGLWDPSTGEVSVDSQACPIRLADPLVAGGPHGLLLAGPGEGGQVYAVWSPPAG